MTLFVRTMWFGVSRYHITITTGQKWLKRHQQNADSREHGNFWRICKVLDEYFIFSTLLWLGVRFCGVPSVLFSLFATLYYGKLGWYGIYNTTPTIPFCSFANADIWDEDHYPCNELLLFYFEFSLHFSGSFIFAKSGCICSLKFLRGKETDKRLAIQTYDITFHSVALPSYAFYTAFWRVWSDRGI